MGLLGGLAQGPAGGWVQVVLGGALPQLVLVVLECVLLVVLGADVAQIGEAVGVCCPVRE